MTTEFQWSIGAAKQQPTPWKKLLVPTDFSAASEAALRVAVSIARRDESRMTLLHVVDINGQAPDIGSVRGVEFMARKRTDGFTKLRDCADSIAAIGLAVVPIVLEGLPCEQILACAKSHDLVVLARTKRRRRWRWFARRTWPAVVADCPASVMLVSL